MMIPSRRKLGAAALIIAGIGAFLVPFLLHSPTTQGTSGNNGGTNPNNGTHPTSPTTTNPTPTTPTNPGTTDSGNGNGGSGGTTNTGTCSDENSDANEDASNDLSVSHSAKSDASDSSKGSQGHAYGLLKHQMDTTVALVKSMGIHNAAFQSHHDTKTDNDTVQTHQANSESSNDHDSACAEKEETNDD